MQQELFDELVRSVREGGAILRGDKKPARAFVVNVDCPAVRQKNNAAAKKPRM